MKNTYLVEDMTNVCNIHLRVKAITVLVLDGKEDYVEVMQAQVDMPFGTQLCLYCNNNFDRNLNKINNILLN